jgi:hypothetical protein
MNKILLASLLITLMACGSHNAIDNSENSSVPDYLLQDNFINTLSLSNHRKLVGRTGNLRSFKEYLNTLNTDSLTSIPFALDYILTCISSDNTDRDSIFLLFNRHFDVITNRLNDSLYTKYKAVAAQLENDSNTVELNAFKKNLEVCGVGIFSTEGTYYPDALPDFFYNNFKGRVSDGVKEFLNIRKDELKQGFSEDASLLISFEDLYGRVKRWENFIYKYPRTVYNEEANSYYVTYLETLMTGMDNSPTFDYESTMLLPEIKNLYEKIIQEEPGSPTTKLISSYYNFLGRHDFKSNDSIETFLKTNNLATMLAVQPNTR